MFNNFSTEQPSPSLGPNIFSNEAGTEEEHGPPSEWALKMMQKMGYQLGSGLGKSKQGITSAIDVKTHLGRRGLGLELGQLNLSNETWDFSVEDVKVEEKVNWLESPGHLGQLTDEIFDSWLVKGPPNHDIGSEFCDSNIAKNVFQAKEIFNELDPIELNRARTRANPFETVKSVFFMNRAALKMANIDAATDFAFTTLDENDNFKCDGGPIYFTDVCAGPGGFTEYIFWRKQWKYKGFGLTLKEGQNDFRLYESCCTSSASFQALYGKQEDGDVCNPENLVDFVGKVKHESEGKGVHFMMSDGGFSVEGKEGLQEILSKNIYICQCFLALKILRPHGLFVTKLFDVFTPFSVGLMFLVYLCFKKVGILKPRSSRPANSERYFICYDFQDTPLTDSVRSYLWRAINKLWSYKDIIDLDILELVPLDVLKREHLFYSYVKDTNNRIGTNQIIALKKLASFCRNPNLQDFRQNVLRDRCLRYWNIPDLSKNHFINLSQTVNFLEELNVSSDILGIQPREILTLQSLDTTLSDLDDWAFCLMTSEKEINRSSIYVGVTDSKVCRFQNGKWVKVRNIELWPGTLLFGEFVKEYVTLNEEKAYRFSLHVIDALHLGGHSLEKMNFEKRSQLIATYCKSINRESETNKYAIRIRHKPIWQLRDMSANSHVQNGSQNDRMALLPTLGYGSVSESFEVNSVLLIKINQGQSFQLSFVLRAQIYMDSKDGADDVYEALMKKVSG